MLGIIGTIPEESFPLIFSSAKLKNDNSLLLEVNKREVPIERGTPALIASACKVLEFFDKGEPLVYLVGDIGRGKGSRELYSFLTEDLKKYAFKVLTFHYLLPEVDSCNKLIFTLEELPFKPFLIADAGFMYVVKMASYAEFFDLFTPDPGELAFLADERAPHPFYTRGFLLQEEDRVEDLVRRAHQHKNLSKYLLVKGRWDYVVVEGKVVEIIKEPLVEVLEVIGGTGDTLTGIVSALIFCGFEPVQACIIASKVNRLAGYLAQL
ncbi:MAG: NAD(P)H-hydrate dehydratase, partial [Thermodesulfobacterium sp.]|nr:NAD(P)H-hydrate dehydratase [Thermodesulfobacterium sp.]